MAPSLRRRYKPLPPAKPPLNLAKFEGASAMIDRFSLGTNDFVFLMIVLNGWSMH